MRGVEAVTAAGRPGLHDHMCWAYDDPVAYGSVAVDFLATGNTLGQLVRWVAPGPADGDAVSMLSVALGRPTSDIVGAGDVYPLSGVVEPAQQVEAYARATRAAVAAGYTGLRVVADATRLVRSSAGLEAFARYEHQIDGFSAREPFAAMCAYNRAELGGDTIAQLACLHPAGSDDLAPFRLSGSAVAAVALSGDIDLACADTFSVAWERADPRPTDGQIRVDARRLVFIDHRTLVDLNDRGRRRDAVVVLIGGPPMAGRLIDLLELTNLVVVVAQ